MFGFKKDESYWKWFGGNIASGAAAGASFILIVYSLNYARTRLVSDVKSSVKGRGERQFNAILDLYKKALKSDGITGIYHGFTPSVMGIIVSRIILRCLLFAECVFRFRFASRYRQLIEIDTWSPLVWSEISREVS